METTNNQSQYINTMVFCIVAGIISSMLLLLVFNANEVVRAYGPLVITVEVGLILIIIIAIWNIIAFENKVERAAKSAFDAKLNVTTCPDYWTQSGQTCTNTFSPQPNVTYTFFGTTPLTTMNQTVRTIKLTDYNNLSVSQTCSKAYTNNYSPWSQVDAVCGSFRLNG
jgi:hypothetical protein